MISSAGFNLKLDALQALFDGVQLEEGEGGTFLDILSGLQEAGFSEEQLTALLQQGGLRKVWRAVKESCSRCSPAKRSRRVELPFLLPCSMSLGNN
ncbi:hypothetical protein CAI21_11770 [Alkalilimnicola ehrlichii]|uniref:Uncharacterized protein n=1 Tax=Alkalilimnicola ehrlichii TaxID=351052 RepID=A0A3E0WRV4_9GAMM|nr:hypothetical protein [Alkalilimnicola ehrlichii]RFA28540.1 hypothetical protein CAI21_11770 [Alkalilimnicola ehrlichii]RFA35702.1 hypothetical protein CAL65_12290 [Alkalilimnicola ehrlichii]